MLASQDAVFLFLRPWIAFLVSLAVFLVIRQLGRRWLYRRATGTDSYLWSLLESTKAPSWMWALMGALWVTMEYSDLPARAARISTNTIAVCLTLSLSLGIASMLERMVSLYGRRNNRPLAAAGLSRTLIYVLVLGIGLVILLRSLGLTVTPLLTALGVGGLAVALALQDTLANFFAGIHIIVESPVSVGDFIRLSSSEEGIVTDIGWRTTRVTNMQNNVIVIPNSKITASILLNFSLPESRLATDVDVVVGHEADLDAVRTMLLEEAAQADSVLADPPPIVLMDPGVTPTHVQLKLWVNIPERTLQGLVRSDLRFRIARRLRREGVPMPRMDYVVTGPPVGA